MRSLTCPSTTLIALLLAFGGESAAQHAYRLSAPLERAPDGKVRDVRVSRDGLRCLYRAEPRGDGLANLYRAATDGSEPVVELGPTASGPRQYELDASGEHVLHLVRDPGTGLRRLVGLRGDGTGSALFLDGGVGDVLDFQLAPAGDAVLFRAEVGAGGAELFAAPTRGGRVFRVNDPLSVGGGVESDYVIGPDGRSVYYHQTHAAGTGELFRGSVVGRPPRRLCAPHAPGSDVLEFVVSGDQARVVYRADSRANNVIELFVAPADGTAAPVRVGPDLPVNADVREFALSPDGGRIVFRADGATAGKIELYSAPSDGLAFVRLNQDLGAAADVLDFRVTPDSSAVAFRANADGVANQELFLAPSDGSSPARRLGPDLGVGQNVRAGYVLRAGKVLYGVDPGAGWQAYVLALDAGAQPVPFGPLALVEHPLFATSTHFLAMADAGLLSVPVDLSSAPVPVDGPNPVLVNPLLTDPVEPGGLLLFPRSEGFESVSLDLVETIVLRSVPADASRPSRALSAPFPKLAYIEIVRALTADASGKHVAYTTAGATSRVFLVESDGRSEPVEVTSSAGPLLTPAFTHDGARLVHVDQSGLYEFPASGSGARTDLVPGASGFLLAARALMALVYRPLGSDLGLLALRFDGSAPIDLLAGLPTGPVFRGEANLTADGRWGVFSVKESSGGFSLLRVPTDGSAAPERMSAAGLYEPASQLASADGTTVAFLEGGTLYRCALASGAGPVSIQIYTGIPQYDFDPNSSDLVVLEAGDLFVHPAGGGVRHLNTAHPGAAETFHLEPSGARALYTTVVAEFSGEISFDLWSVPLDGSLPALRVNTDAAWPAVRRFGVHLWLDTSPDGRTVAYTSAGRLMAGSLDGSHTPLVLSDDPLRFSDVLPASDFSADSESLVFVSRGLFSVPRAGGRQPRRLDSPAFGGLSRPDVFKVLGQGRGVLFIEDTLQEGVDELFLGVLDRPVRGVPR